MRVSIIFSIESSHIPIFYFSFARIYSILDSSLRRIALAKLLVQTLDRVRGWLSLLREPVVMVEIASPPPFSLLVSLSLSLFRYLRELVPRLHVAPTYEYQLPMGLPSRAYVLLPNIPNTLPIILPSSDLTSFARLRL